MTVLVHSAALSATVLIGTTLFEVSTLPLLSFKKSHLNARRAVLLAAASWTVLACRALLSFCMFPFSDSKHYRNDNALMEEGTEWNRMLHLAPANLESTA